MHFNWHTGIPGLRDSGLLEPTINNTFAWFRNNGLVANSGKSQFLVSPYEKINLKILGSTVECSAC